MGLCHGVKGCEGWHLAAIKWANGAVPQMQFERPLWVGSDRLNYARIG